MLLKDAKQRRSSVRTIGTGVCNTQPYRPKECRASSRCKLPNQDRHASGRVVTAFFATPTKQELLQRLLQSAAQLICSPSQPGCLSKFLLGEAVESFLDREAAVGVVHVVVDDQIVKLLRLGRRWQPRRRQRQQQDLAQPELKRRCAPVHARIAGVHQPERDRA